jgi:hypothetical protein
MSLNKRPLSLTILGCIYIAVGTVGFVYHFKEFEARHAFQYDAVWIAYGPETQLCFRGSPVKFVTCRNIVTDLSGKSLILLLGDLSEMDRFAPACSKLRAATIFRTGRRSSEEEDFASPLLRYQVLPG